MVYIADLAIFIRHFINIIKKIILKFFVTYDLVSLLMNATTDYSNVYISH